MASVVILGNDLAGLGLARQLARLGCSDVLHLVESRPGQAGAGDGLIPSDDTAFELARQILGENPPCFSSRVEGCWGNHFIRLPVETHLTDLPAEVAKEWLLGFIRLQSGTRTKPDRRGSTLKDWLRENYGTGIADGFWIPYFAKRTGVEPSELIASQRSGLLTPASLEEVADGVFSAVDPAHQGEPVSPRSLADDRLREMLAARAPGRPWSGEAEIDLARKMIRLSDGSVVEYDQLVCSLPLPRLGKLLPTIPGEIRASFQTLRFVSSVHSLFDIEGPTLASRRILFPDRRHPFHRILVESPPQGGGAGRVTVETAHLPGHPPDPKPDQEEQALRGIGLLTPEHRVIGRSRASFAFDHVLQDERHHPSVRLITQFLEDQGVITIGPWGGWNNWGSGETLAATEPVAKAILHSQQHGVALRAPERMPQVSIVIPVYREEAVLEQFTTQIIEAVDRLQIPYELILAENGGRDRTGELADRLATRFRQVRAVHYPEPNYGKALAMGILTAAAENVVCFEIDFWDAEFVEIAQVLLKKYDAVIGSKRAPGARDRRPLLRRAITAGFNLFLKLVYGFQGTDTHGVKAFRREEALPIVRACTTGKDIFATELVLRMERAGLYICEMPLEIQELRSPSINLLKRVPSTIRSLAALWRATRKLPRTDFRKMEPAPKVSITS